MRAAAAGTSSPAAETRRLVALAGPWLAAAVAVGIGQAVLVIAQASILARLLAAAFHDGLTPRSAAADCLWLVALGVAQGLSGWAWEILTEAAARRARAATRHRALLTAIAATSSAALVASEPGRGEPTAGEQGQGPGPGGMAALFGSGIDELDPFVARVLPRAVLVVAVPALLLAWIGRLDLVSAGLAGLAVLIAAMLAGLVGADTAAAVRRRLASVERLAERFDALIEGLPVLRAFGRARDHERAVAASGEDVRRGTLATLRVALLAGLVLELLAAMGTALVAVRLGLRLDAGQRILPRALAVLMLTPEVFLPLRRLAADFHAGAGGHAVLARLSGLAITGEPDSTGHQAGPPSRDTDPVGVVLEAVCLVAEGRARPLLDRIDLGISPGEHVCLIGASGAGKSSLLRVVAGLAAPSAGHVGLENLAAGFPLALGWLPQHPTVLPATILDNVALGRPGVDERTVVAALRAAQLGSWLRSLPQGLRTPLSELDAPLSLGERRRLAVARTLAGPRPRLWLIDEPTAGLDRQGARRLVTELGRVIGGATAVIATHDPLVMTLAQRTVELCRGRIRPADHHLPAPGRLPAPATGSR
ncbi:MAG TPA: ATP-binding cassette domain-containing protein [Trebonia sp.]|jgi:ABC-type transport system involved in cytochrome bd biosynthesis fused ATPase/permease subunit|nr:ATP-binding cassette domain-containing protein [Trebonia sp.]